MDLSIFTVAHSGYGRFLLPWASSVAGLSPPAGRVVIVLGPDHGLSTENEQRIKDIIQPLPLFVESRKPLSNGGYRNLAMEYIESEWSMMLDADDQMLSSAIASFSPLAERSDLIVPSYIKIRQGVGRVIQARLPWGSPADWRGKGYFLSASAPFRTRFLGSVPFFPIKHPNIPFTVEMALAGARFSACSSPSHVFWSRPDSMSGSRTDEEKEAIYSDLDQIIGGLLSWYKK